MVVVYYRTIEHTEQADMTPPTPKQSQKKKIPITQKWMKERIEGEQYPIPNTQKWPNQWL